MMDSYEELVNHVLTGVITVHDTGTNTYLGEWVVKVGHGNIHYTAKDHPKDGLPALPANIFEDHIDKMVRMYHNGYYKTDVCGWVK